MKVKSERRRNVLVSAPDSICNSLLSHLSGNCCFEVSAFLLNPFPTASLPDENPSLLFATITLKKTKQQQHVHSVFVDANKIFQLREFSLKKIQGKFEKLKKKKKENLSALADCCKMCVLNNNNNISLNKERKILVLGFLSLSLLISFLLVFFSIQHEKKFYELF